MTKNPRFFQSVENLRKIILLSAVFSAFQKTSETGEILKAIEEAIKEEDDFKRIRCPLCRWQPDKSSRWFCADCDAPEYFYGGCLTSWNTFETRGLCPGCAHQWIWTSCLRCAGWSRHEDWYEEKSS